MRKLWVIAVMALLITLAPSQSLNGVGLGVAVSSVSQCTPSSGAAVTLCPVTADGLYMAVGSGSFTKIPTNIVVPTLTKISCTTSAQSNSGFTASGCTIN